MMPLVYLILGGHLAGAWAVLRSMGQNGYMEMAEKLFATAEKMRAGVRRVEVCFPYCLLK